MRPKKPGLRLWVWKKLVYVFLQYGPLIRERLALRSRSLSPTSQAILLDVVASGLDSTSDSLLWPPIGSTLEVETSALSNYLLGLCDTLWVDIHDPRSLAGRIRERVGSATTVRSGSAPDG